MTLFDKYLYMPYYYSPFRKDYDKKNNSKNLSKPKDKKYKSIFCDPDIINSQGVFDINGKLIENEHYYWLINWYPRTEGHTMIIPKRYITEHSEESEEEILARHSLMVYAIDIMKKAFDTDATEIFNQRGRESYSSVDHLHWHLVPVRKNDPLWNGSFHNMEKMGYFYTDTKDKQKVVMFPIEIQYAQTKLQELLAKTIGEFTKI